MKRIWEEYSLIVILAIQIFMVCAGILSRYWFNWSISFTEELTRYLILWLTCFGLAACVYRKETIHFQWPKRWQSHFLNTRYWILCLVTLLFLAAVFYSAVQMMRMQVQFQQTTSVMGWPIVWVSVSLPVLCLLYVFRFLFARPR